VRPPFVHSVQIQNYRSIANCDVKRLGPLTLLVGPNGSGKSNFLDALRFMADALRLTLEHAVRDRGGIDQVRRRSGGHPRHFGLPGAGTTASYAFRVGARANGGYVVQREECRVYTPPPTGERTAYFVVENGALREGTIEGPRQIEPDRLYLTLASALPDFRPVYDGLSRLGFYNLNPEIIRDLQDPDPGEILARDGRNIASVVRRLREESPESLDRVVEYLRAIVPGVHTVQAKSVLSKETLEFDHYVSGARNPWHFMASSMSDGTLRALGVLVAVFQGAGRGGMRLQIPLAGIEEPEVAIHPGAAVKLMDALLEARHRIQILATTHSPELLDHPDVDADQILVVDIQDGATVIGPVGRVTREAVRDRLYTVGELLRLQQIVPSDEAVEAAGLQFDLFSPDLS
jgi:predicted ATPase